MEICVKQADLSEMLAIAAKFIPSRPTHPVLGCVLLEASEGVLSLTGFDLSMGCRLRLPVDVAKSGKAAITFRLFKELTDRLSGNLILTVNASEDDPESLTATIGHSGGKMELRCMGAEEYPELPSVDDVSPINLPVSVLRDGIRAVASFASTDETKQVLTGVHFKATTGETPQEGTIEFAATNGHYLAVTTLDTAIADPFDVTIPSRALSALEKMMASLDPLSLIEIRIDGKQAVFTCGDNIFTTRILEGAYPVYRQLIPTAFAAESVMETKETMNAVDIVAVFSDKKSSLVQLDFSDNSCIFSVEAQDVGNAKQAVKSENTGAVTKLAFNQNYINASLRHIETREFKMQFNAENQPVIFTPLGGANSIYLVMPVQVRN